MLRAIMRSETDAAALAALARGRLRGKIPVLQQAATGSRNQHHRFLIEQWMAMWDELGTRIAQLEERIEEQIRPFEPVVETWARLPGIDRVTAWTMVVTGYMLVWTGRTFEDSGADYFDRLDRDRLTKRLVKRLERFGHKVSLQPAA